EERSRIARELHDLIGHTVNVMLVQAGAARLLIQRDPDRARMGLESLEEAGRSALGELDRMLGILRTETTAHRPQPGLDQLPILFDRFEKSGLHVSYEVTGARPPGAVRPIELSAYRIVQEALTNTLKHADAGQAEVQIEYTGKGIDIEVVDDGQGGSGFTSGRGLVGIGERAAVFDGHVEHGPVKGGGFRVHAFLAAT
ncbi:MAG TPA: sensor histidine kinase, partial [Actinobacteria bacterium]|nr:sensor histidine kinase [Actinomycetota bacterium]